MPPHITLQNIFDLQEKLIKNNSQTFAPEYLFIKDCLELLLNIPIDSEVIKENEKKKICNIVNVFFSTGRSSLITSTKLLLYGCPGDALACLRVAWEAIICIEYMMVFEAFNEFDQNYLIKKKKINCGKLAGALDKKDKRRRMFAWNDLSDYGSHISYSKFTLQQVKINGKSILRIGAGALAPMTAHNVSARITQVVLYAVRTMAGFYDKSVKIELPEIFHWKVHQLTLRYNQFVEKSKEKVKSLETEVIVP